MIVLINAVYHVRDACRECPLYNEGVSLIKFFFIPIQSELIMIWAIDLNYYFHKCCIFNVIVHNGVHNTNYFN